MTGAALTLVLSAAVIHATWNAMAKGARDPMAMLWWAGVLSSLVLAPPSLYVLAREGFSPRALPFVVATVILHSMYFFSLGKAYQTGDFSVVYPMARGMGVALVPAVRARPGSMAREWRENRLAVLLSGVLSPGGYLLVLFAFRLSKAGYVVAGREVSIVISALIGSILLKEGRLPQRLLGA